MVSRDLGSGKGGVYAVRLINDVQWDQILSIRGRAMKSTLVEPSTG